MEALPPLAGRAAALLKARRETIAVAESSAGGLVCAALLAVPGASVYFRGGAVVYTRDARRALLGIPDAALDGVPPNSEPLAALLAEAARARLGTTWGLGETGAAGPTGNRYGAGHACLAVAGPAARSVTLRNRKRRPRSQHAPVRRGTAAAADRRTGGLREPNARAGVGSRAATRRRPGRAAAASATRW